MKKMIISAFALAMATTASYAQTATPAATSATPAATATAPQAAQQDNKTKIDVAALPAPVKTTLASDSYKGWTVSNAWQSGNLYIIELKNGENTKTVNLDKDGKQVG